jgi:hypothetical protein
VRHGVRKSAVTNYVEITGRAHSPSINPSFNSRTAGPKPLSCRATIGTGWHASKTQGPQSDANPRLRHHTHKRQLHPASTAHSLSHPRVPVQRHPRSSPSPGIRPRRAALAVQIHLQWGAKADAVLHLDRTILAVDEWGSRAAQGRARKRKAGGVRGGCPQHEIRPTLPPRRWRRPHNMYRVILLSAHAPRGTEGLSGG